MVIMEIFVYDIIAAVADAEGVVVILEQGLKSAADAAARTQRFFWSVIVVHLATWQELDQINLNTMRDDHTNFKINILLV
jgi:hypothetical protein